MSPEHLYYLALIVLVMPCAPFNRTAAVVLGCWVATHFAVTAGVDPSIAQLGEYTIGMVFGMKVADNARQMAAAAMYAPLLSVAFLDASGLMPPIEAWWAIYWTAMAQIPVAVSGTRFRVGKFWQKRDERKGGGQWFAIA